MVDVEVVGATPIEFCLPASGVNPVLVDPATGDRGGGSDGTIGGEATADASALPGEGAFTFGIVSPASGSFDITVFVEEPGGPNDNDPDEGEPHDTASLTVGPVAEGAVAAATSGRPSRSLAPSRGRSDRRMPSASKAARSW